MDIKQLSALELSKMMTERQIPVSEVFDHFAGRLEDIGGARIFESARAWAAEIQRLIDAGDIRSPLMGVPVGLGANICVKGEICDAGSKILLNFRPPFDATAVSRMREAGMIVMASLPGDEFGIEGVGEVTPAAFVSKGGVPLALASDTGGGARTCACWEDLFCVRPTYGAVSRHGLIAYASSMDQICPIGRSLEDCAALLEIISGEDPLDIMTSGVAEAKLSEGGRAYLGREYGSWEDAVSFEGLDHALPAFVTVAYAEASGNMARFDGIKYGRQPGEYSDLNDLYFKARTEGFTFRTRFRLALGTTVLTEKYFDKYYGQALKIRGHIASELKLLLEKHGMLVMPTVGSSLETGIMGIEERSRYCMLAALAGLPCVSVPASGERAAPGCSGVQLMGPAFSDKSLIRAAAEEDLT